MKKATKRFLAFILIIAGIWYFNNFTIKTTKQDIIYSKISNDIKITVISDLHGFSFGINNSNLVSKIKNSKPDIIFVLGDMYSTGSDIGAKRAINLIKRIAEFAPVYVVTGEHDDDEFYKESVSEIENVILMNYKQKKIEINGNDICIYGIDNVYFSPTFDLHHAFKDVDNDVTNILLAHIPNYTAYEDFNADLIFSGDSHGGMVRLPYIGPLYYNGVFFPKYKYHDLITSKGLYDFNKSKIFVTSGLGGYPLIMRLNNRPEVCSITIKGE